MDIGEILRRVKRGKIAGRFFLDLRRLIAHPPQTPEKWLQVSAVLKLHNLGQKQIRQVVYRFESVTRWHEMF